ncbi:MAG TPA: transcription-repair coupling factor [Kofleriaceae bacterium]|nr:transcription-repair coupling factor [Kofleriaceae bacterium]
MSSPGATLSDLLARATAGPVVAYGLSAPAAAYAAARLLDASPASRLVVAVADEERAHELARDLRLFLPPLPDAGQPGAAPRAELIAAPGSSPYAEVSPDRAALLGRMTALHRLAANAAPRAVVLSASSLLRRVIPPAELAALSFRIATGDTLDRDATVAALLAAGYRRAPVVEDPGTFAVKGGVIDLFPPLYGFPVRLELFGDEVESLRAFDPATQRTLRPLDQATVHPVRETIATRGADLRRRILDAADAAAQPSRATRRLLEQIEAGEDLVGLDTLTPAFHARLAPVWEYVPAATWLVIDPDAILRAAADELEEAAARHQERIADHRISFPPEEHLVSSDELAAALAAPARIEVRSLEIAGDRDDLPAVRFAAESSSALRLELERARRQKADQLMEPLVVQLGRWREAGWRVAIVCSSASRSERLAALLRDYGVDAAERALDPLRLADLTPGGPPALVRGRVSTGFTLPGDKLALLSDEDIFGPRRTTSARQTQAARRAKDALLGGVSDFSQLAPGDFVVHRVHGIGHYQGLTKLPVAGTPIDFLQLTYDGGQLYLPVYRLDEVQRYVGAEGIAPRLDKLGGVTWEKSRRKAGAEVRAMAEELLQLYAQRAALPGHAFPPADAMFREFEATFPFEETPDQETAINDVMADMEKPSPMDRLVCGDVGYGKTEVALRAMLKAVLGGSQAAMLAPTTVLVEQHYQTMLQRFAGWPMVVARLSRFQSQKDQLAVVRGLADGSIDAVVGTHRLLSNDIRFKNLGLLIIDEEQRFGVAHKERLKRMRTQLDVLTLTATPIPRTLHLSMTGLRDLSIIATPPADRRSIRTLVARPEDGVLREGIRRELARGGQVFFVAPRIAGVPGDKQDLSIEEWAKRLRELVPEARITTAHGQMPAEALEKAMVDFVGGRQDILVCTTIVESGLDIPRANTMFVARADRMGLAQLYQLRGRIGRSRERAFCYLLLPAADGALSDDGRRRLEALQRFSDLGSGFLIASHDLEIRGAGELFGRKQSGSIAAVGFETYAALLEEAVAELKGEEIIRPRDPELNVEVPGFIPDEYVPDTGQRLDLYKRLAGAAGEDDVSAILDEMMDRYGPLPPEVTVLADLMVLKALARRIGAQSLELARTRLSVALAEDTPLRPERVLALVEAPGSLYRLTPDMRLARSFNAAEQKAPAEAARRSLLELVACAS